MDGDFVARLGARGVSCHVGRNGRLQIDITGHWTDEQARRLGEVLLDWPYQPVPVCEMHIPTSGLTAAGNYQPLLDFIQGSPVLKTFELFHNNLNASYDEQQEIARQFLHVFAQSTIQTLQIIAFSQVPMESITDLVSTTSSITDLTMDINFAVGVSSVQPIEAAFSQNTTVRVLTLTVKNRDLVTGVMRAMKVNPTIKHLRLWHLSLSATFLSSYRQLAQELPSFIGLQRLQCVIWPTSTHSIMMDGFKSNSSLLEVLFIGDPERVRLAKEEVRPYLERNRGMRALIESPGNLPDILIPRACAATRDAYLHRDVIYGLVKENPQMFQRAPEELSWWSSLVHFLVGLFY